MDKNIEQRICHKFCIANEILCAESLKMSQKAFWVLRINSYQFKRLYRHETRCCLTNSERPEFPSKTQSRKVAKNMLERVNSDPTFIKRIVTGDETWAHEFGIQTS